MRRINDGEEVGITVVLIAEIANLLKSYLPLSKLLRSSLGISFQFLTAKKLTVKSLV